MNKNMYIDLMESVMAAYTDDHIKAYTQSVIDGGLKEHGYPRLTANIGILIAHGRKTEYKDEFRKMMDLCCDEIPVAHGKNGMMVGNEFSVKEIVFCLLEIEKSRVFDKSITDEWRRKLALINPYETYSVIASVPPVRIGNWAAFGGASEQVRKYAGIGDESAFIDNQIKSQLFSFDENGMYRDPNEPMVYDFVTRLQLAVALHFGLEGESRDALEKEMQKSADITLQMQSVTGEIPFGGRSNQFLLTEAFYAALCEYYATVFKNQGDLVRAGKFKNAARIATENIIPWLKEDKIRHIRNYYETDSKFGCEDYAYFDKYMVTTGSWLYHAYIMAEDGIDEVDCPSVNQSCICETSPYFHKVMCRYHDYYVQFETKADTHYDASGIGRIHKRGAPSTLCLSVPFSENPNYVIDITNPSCFSVCAGIKTANGYGCTAEESTEYKLVEKTIHDNFVRVKFECITEKGMVIYKTCTISDDGVEIVASGDGEIEILFPVFEFDGETYTETAFLDKKAVVVYKGYKCIYSTDGIIVDKKSVYANRNGHYTGAAAVGEGSVSLKVEITKN